MWVCHTGCGTLQMVNSTPPCIHTSWLCIIIVLPTHGHGAASIYIALHTCIIVRSSRPIMHHLQWPWPHKLLCNGTLKSQWKGLVAWFHVLGCCGACFVGYCLASF